MTWERPLIKKETHAIMIKYAESNGLKIWRAYELAANNLTGGEKSDT